MATIEAPAERHRKVKQQHSQPEVSDGTQDTEPSQHSQGNSPQHADASVANTSQNDMDQFVKEYQEIENKLGDQSTKLLFKKEQLKERKAAVAAAMKQRFDELREFLDQHEADLLETLASSTLSAEESLSTMVGEAEKAKSFAKTEKNVARSKQAGDDMFEDISANELQSLYDDILTGLRNRDRDLEKDIIVPSFAANEDAFTSIKDSSLGQIVHEHALESPTNEEEEKEEEEEEKEEEEEEEDAAGWAIDGDIPDRLNEYFESETRDILPTAPPLADTEDDEDEPPPPTYWEATGLASSFSQRDQRDSKQEKDGAWSPSPPSQNDPLKLKNTVQLWRAFKGQVQERRHSDRYGAKIAKIVAVKKIVCVLDKKNKAIKFFTHRGDLLDVISVDGADHKDITDITFLDGDSKLNYLAVSPQGQCFYRVTFNRETSTASISPKRDLFAPYTCIAKGATSDTFVCATRNYNPGLSSINIVTMTGMVLYSFTCTLSGVYFMYPRFIETFETTIIVSDWKLGEVILMKDDGTQVGQYKGTTRNPIKEPLDVTVDVEGNVFIVESKLGSLHVIDRNCTPLVVVSLRGIVQSPGLVSFDQESNLLVVDSLSNMVNVLRFKEDYVPYNFLSHDSDGTVAAGDSQASDGLPALAGMLPITMEGAPRKNVNRRGQWPRTGPMMGQQMAGQQMMGQSMAGQQMMGQPMAGQQMMGQPMAGQPFRGPQLMGQWPQAGYYPTGHFQLAPSQPYRRN